MKLPAARCFCGRRDRLAAGGTEKAAAGTAHTLADYHDGTGRRLRLDDGTRL